MSIQARSTAAKKLEQSSEPTRNFHTLSLNIIADTLEHDPKNTFESGSEGIVLELPIPPPVMTIEQIASEMKSEDEISRAASLFASTILQRFYDLDAPLGTPGNIQAREIQNQLNMVRVKYAEWFNQEGLNIKVNSGIVEAAIVCTDVTKKDPNETMYWVQKLPSEDGPHVTNKSLGIDLSIRAIIPDDRIAWDNPLVALLFHSTAGTGFAQYHFNTFLNKESLSPPQHAELVQRTSDAIIGHDTFNAGFGKAILKGEVQKILALENGYTIEYQRSQTPEGFIVQILDRLDACGNTTQRRYVQESFSRLDSTTNEAKRCKTAIMSGIVRNAQWMKACVRSIEKDIKATIHDPYQREGILRSPLFQDLKKEVARLQDNANLFVPERNAIAMKTPEGLIKIESIEQFLRLWGRLENE